MADQAPTEPSNDLTEYRPLPTSDKANWSLWLGIIGMTILPFLGSILATIFGVLALREINSSQGKLGGRTQAIVGLVLSAIPWTCISLLILFQALNSM